jgi:ATP adenylyltransferase
MRFLSAPWRWKFISGQSKENGCLFCRALEADSRDSLVCHRGEKYFVLLNKYPYSTGHLMIAPLAHIASPEREEAGGLLEMWQLAQRAMAILREAFHAEGFNIGMNVGGAAGAGVKDHFHLHVVPRWPGDANFMATVGDTRVMSCDPQQVLAAVRAAFARREAPPATAGRS